MSRRELKARDREPMRQLSCVLCGSRRGVDRVAGVCVNCIVEMNTDDEPDDFDPDAPNLDEDDPYMPGWIA